MIEWKGLFVNGQRADNNPVLIHNMWCRIYIDCKRRVLELRRENIISRLACDRNYIVKFHVIESEKYHGNLQPIRLKWSGDNAEVSDQVPVQIQKIGRWRHLILSKGTRTFGFLRPWDYRPIELTIE